MLAWDVEATDEGPVVLTPGVATDVEVEGLDATTGVEDDLAFDVGVVPPFGYNKISIKLP